MSGRTLPRRVGPGAAGPLVAIAVSVAAISAARAQVGQPPDATVGSTPVERITVRPSPLADMGDDMLLPTGGTTLRRSDVDFNGTPDLLDALGTDVAGVELDNASGNPLQPTLFYNGFEASPLQGTSQGLAVYLNGVRFNDPFGDTVNWDLIPQIAISRVSIEDSDPVYGLNALGGAASVHLRDGFDWQGEEADISGGSFDTTTVDGQYGARFGDFALYAAGTEEHQGGWRDLQSSDVQNLYVDGGWRDETTAVHLDLTLANTSLNGPGTAPVQLLAVDPEAQFTGPNLIANKFIQLALSGTKQVGSVLLDGNSYYGYFQQRVINGNAADDEPCDDGTELLCSDNGVSTTRGGASIADFTGGGQLSELDEQTTNTNRYGASGQASGTLNVAGLPNRFLAGASFDGAQTLFSATSLLGALTPDSRVFVGPGIVIDEPGENVPVRVGVSDAYVGVYASDTLDLTPRFSVTGTARFNSAQIDLSDEGGGDLSGHHAFNHVNPSIGAVYRIAPWLNVYVDEAQANRAPTPAELSCAGPSDSCSLANFFVGDPDLKQVVAHTVETGLRGTLARSNGEKLTYRVGLFETTSNDDIVFVNSPELNRAFFTNIGSTRRRGLDASLVIRASGWSLSIDYAYVEAMFETGFLESAGSNPAADPNGDLTIRPGDRLPGVPPQRLSFQADARLTPRWTAGMRGVLQAGQYFFGDEANVTPKLPGFFTLELHTSFNVTKHLQFYATVQNVTDASYATFGTFSPVQSVALAQAPNASNPRSLSPAAPIGTFGGAKITF